MAVLSIFVRSFVVVFADLFFLYFFLPVCLICYFITRSTAIRNAVLVVFSLIFYAWGEPVWVSILIVSSLVDYINGRVIEKHPEGWQAKVALAWSLVFNLGVLFGFKYTAFFVENLNNWFGLGIPVPNIVLPIGISFYTFQTISYTVDCYWGKVKPQKKIGRFLLYVSMFPQLVAGPIVRYSVIGEEINERKTTAKDISDGFSRIILGLGKKVIIANNLSTIVTALFGSASNGYENIKTLSVAGTWLGIILTSQAIQISLSVLAGYSASTLMRTLNILSSAKLSQSSGRGGISPLAHFSEIMCFISLSSAKEENTEDFSLYGSVQDFGTAQAGTSFSGDFTMDCSYSLKCS